MTETISMNVRSVDDAGIIDITGDLTAASDAALSDAYTQASDIADVVVLNFAGLEYMNSSGIGLLVTLLIRANRQKKRLAIGGLSEHYRNIFQITRLDDAIVIYATEDEAVAAA